MNFHTMIKQLERTHTQTAIAKAIGITQGAVSRVSRDPNANVLGKTALRLVAFHAKQMKRRKTR